MEIEKKLKNLPQEPGVYLMRDKSGKIIYIGKAVNLKNRIRSYFRPNSDARYFVSLLDGLLGNIETMVTQNEIEALLLENELIKKYKPRFNIKIKSEGYFLYVRIDIKQAFPRFELVRKTRNDGALYFGPYHSAKAIRETSHLLGQVFGLRTCTDSFFKRRKKTCLEYQINYCLGPCTGFVSQDEYAEAVNRVSAFLSGKKKELISIVKEKMKTAAHELNFEFAAKARDFLKNVEALINDQIIILPDHLKTHTKNEKLLHMTMKELKLQKKPQKIECYDISNISGKDAYGSMTVFKNAVPSKKDYRCFKIKLKQTPDDYIMMEELLTRRFKKIAAGEDLPPDLIIIDGGSGHLSTALKVFENFKINSVDILAMAKERKENGEVSKPERLYLAASKGKPIILKNQQVLHLLMRIRDEAHRFALKLHRKAREKRIFSSPLDQIPFVGKARKKALLLHFGSIKNLMKANVEEISEIKYINKQLAYNIFRYFHRE